MGGAVLSKEASQSILHVLNESKSLSSAVTGHQLDADASDITSLEHGRQEIAHLRCLCHTIHSGPVSEELIKVLNETEARGSLSFPITKEIEIQQSRPLDGSDIDDLLTAKDEIKRLRSIWLSIRFSEEDIQKILPIEERKENQRSVSGEEIRSTETTLSKALSNAIAENPILISIRERVTNETASNYFHQFDQNSSGLIERNELRRFIRMQGGGVVYEERDLEELLDLFDLNGDGKLSYGEFLRAFSQDSTVLLDRANSLTQSIQSKLLSSSSPLSQSFSSVVPGLGHSDHHLETFKRSDKDSSGVVDRAEMRRLLRVNGITYKEEEFESFFSVHDLTGDGKLNFEEFCRALSYSPSKP